MAFDDHPLERTTTQHTPEPAPPSPSWLRGIVFILAGVLAGALLMFWWMSRVQPTPAAPPSPTAPDVAVGSNRPKRQSIELPALDDSDTLLRDLVSTLSKHPTLARLLATSGIVRGATMAVVQVGDGRTPADPLKVLRPATRLGITGTNTGKIDPRTYQRWDAPVAALTSVSPTDAAQLYVNVKPLLDQAYVELGHPGEDFDSAIVRAIDMLAETPEVTSDPVLLRRPGYYEHDDQALRALRPVQKQLLLTGPDNRRRVLAWLKSFAAALDLKTH
ncbi:MAG: DUF3014 domain-containing protein [Acidobacteriota bacterium]